jgi:hypothetical protein
MITGRNQDTLLALLLHHLLQLLCCLVPRKELMCGENALDGQRSA